MKSEMFERVATAIELILVEYKDEVTTSGMARMATGYVLKAMREPTEAMECAGNEIREPCDLCSGSICVADQVWLAMIDAAITPSTPA